MKLTKEELLAFTYETMAEVNRKIGTEFTKDNVEIAFFVPENGIKVFEDLCRSYFPKYLREPYREEGYFETFAAMALIGEEKDGILFREDLNFTRREWNHTILHEFSHIIVGKAELDGESFYDKYCFSYADNKLDDGDINAGYAIWREFSAELFASELDDDFMPYRLNDAKNNIKSLLPYITFYEPNAKAAMQMMLNIVFRSDDYFLSKDSDAFIERIKKSEVKEILCFEPIIRLIFEHFHQGCSYKIDVDFIRELGCKYLLSLTNIQIALRRK